MREGYQREKTSFLVWLISALIAVFVVELLFSALLHTSSFSQMVALSASALRDGRVWTLLTYPLLHTGALHLIAILLPLFFIGRELSTHLSDRRLFALAVAATLGGGLAWFGLHFDDLGTLAGASSILWCYFAVFACLYPNREISFLIFFVIPVTTRPKYVACALVAVDFVGALFTELQPDKFPNYPISHSAHLGAMFVGWLYYRYVHEASWLLETRADREMAAWKKRHRKALPPPASEVEVSAPATREVIRAEVDRILDKINSHGLASLTPEEKRMLDDAKNVLSGR